MTDEASAAAAAANNSAGLAVTAAAGARQSASASALSESAAAHSAINARDYAIVAAQNARLFSMLGIWDPGITYYPMNFVTRNGSSYVATKQSKNVPPESDATRWQLVAASASGLSEPPVNVFPPLVIGATELGGKLVVFPGLWAHDPESFTLQWLRGGSDIAAATGPTYATVPADIGNVLAIRVTAANMFGSGSPVTSETTGEVTGGLSSLALSASVFFAGDLPGTLVGSLIGRTTGSSLLLTDDHSSAVALSGGAIIVGAAPPPPPVTFSVTVQETLVGAINSPMETTLAVTELLVIPSGLIIGLDLGIDIGFPAWI